METIKSTAHKKNKAALTEEQKLCPHCHNLEKSKGGDVEYGPEFPIVEYDDLFYIRKNYLTRRYELVFEGENDTNSCVIHFCPLCGRELIFSE